MAFYGCITIFQASNMPLQLYSVPYWDAIRSLRMHCHGSQNLQNIDEDKRE